MTDNPKDPARVLSLLKTHFGYDSFRPNQEAIITAACQGEDVLAIMPTGGGKSLCYQLTALARRGTAIVVSPLIALMKDQVDVLKANGIAAAYFNSSQSTEEQGAILEALDEGRLDLFYLAPERLTLFLERFQNIEISLFAIDEAHCISSWGHDFRPAYTQLGQLKEGFPGVPIMALTATADGTTQDDIVAQLHIPGAQRHLASFNRPNLFLEVRPGQERMKRIIAFLADRPRDSGIIYCLSRKRTEQVAAGLKKAGYRAAAYHAGLDPAERSAVQEDFITDKVPIVAATIAFGMGIDKSNVRWVIHYNLPKNIEGYYQEIGRAGRDGLPAHALLFYSFADVAQLRRFISQSDMAEVEGAKLERMQQFAEALSCRRIALLNYFGEAVAEDCGNCDICERPPAYFDGTLLTQKVLSAIARLKEREAMGTVIDVLRGAKNAAVYDKGYQHIKTYAALKEVAWVDLQQYLVQLLNQGVLHINFREGGRLLLTPLAKEVLFSGRRIQLAVLDKGVKKKEKQSSAPSKTGGLFERLRQLRQALAREAGVPPYVVFGDASLKDMEAKMPKDKAAFMDITGVGQAKLLKYADVFLKEIAAYDGPTQTAKRPTEEQSWSLYKEGRSISEIAAHRKLKEDTIMMHMMKMHAGGTPVDLHAFLDPGDMERIVDAKAEVPNASGLKDYYEHLEGRVPYWKIKLALYLLEGDGA